MPSPLQRLTYISIIFAALVVGLSQANMHLKRYQNEQAMRIVIDEMVKECQQIKTTQGFNDTFSQTSIALHQLLETQSSPLSEEHYLEILSRCITMPSKKNSI